MVRRLVESKPWRTGPSRSFVIAAPSLSVATSWMRKATSLIPQPLTRRSSKLLSARSAVRGSTRRSLTISGPLPLARLLREMRSKSLRPQSECNPWIPISLARGCPQPSSCLPFHFCSDQRTNQIRSSSYRRPGSTGSEGRRLSSTSLARLPLTCAVKRSVRLGLARYRLAIGLLILSGFFGLYMRARYRRHVATSAQVPALVDLVLGRLSNQKVLGEEDIDDPWLFLPNLRDDVLRSVHSLSERDRIWQKV